MSTLTRRPRDAALIYLILEGATALLFGLVFTVNMVYQATTVGLNPLQLVLVGTTLEVTVFLFEVPTGIVADVYSRRLSVIIGMFIIGAGFMVEGLIPHFEAVLLAQVLWGLGYTFTSGATQAWIADEIGEKRAGPIFLRASQIGAVGGLAAIPLSVGLASITIALPIALAGALFAGLGLFLIVVMPETGFHPVPQADRSSWGAMYDTLRDGVRLVRSRSILLILLAVSALAGLYSEGFDRLWTKHILDNFTLPTVDGFDPVVWFGVISAVSGVASIAVSEIVRRRLNMTSQAAMARALFVVTTLTALGIAGFALARGFGLALAMLWLARIARSVEGPLCTAWLNQHIESQVRATVFSMSSQVNAISQVAGGPIVGWIGTIWSLRAALTISSLILAGSLPLYAYTARLDASTEVEAEPSAA